MIRAFGEQGYISALQWQLRQCCLGMFGCKGDCCWEMPPDPKAIKKPVEKPAWPSEPAPKPEPPKPTRRRKAWLSQFVPAVDG